MSDRLCRWGILGTANIARKNWHSILNSGNGKLVAVASREFSRAEQFIFECQGRVPYPTAPVACGYDELVDMPEIDAVYVPLPTALRKEWVLRAARAGKHVLCEKPCGVHAADVAEMLEVCRQHRVQFMDGVMFLHSERLRRMRDVLDDGSSVGQIRRVASQFSFYGGDAFLEQNIRANAQLEPLGCLGDLGWYNIRFTLWAMKHQPPERVSGRLLSSVKPAGGGDPVPLEFAGEMLFRNGVSASFYCSFITQLQQWADISGSQGRLFVKDFVLPYYGSQVSFEVHQDHFEVSGCQFNMENHRQRISVPEYSNNATDAQETNLFRKFAQLALSGQTDPSWGESVLLTQRVLDACLDSARRSGAWVEFA